MKNNEDHLKGDPPFELKSGVVNLERDLNDNLEYILRNKNPKLGKRYVKYISGHQKPQK